MWEKVSLWKKWASIQRLQNDIDLLQSSPKLSVEMKQFLCEQRNVLNKIYKQEAQGARVRSRFQFENETDSCSTYFFQSRKTEIFLQNSPWN